MSTHTIRITKVERAEDFDMDFDEVEWEVESCPDCKLWTECEECRAVDDREALRDRIYDSPDYPTLELHGVTHRVEEGFVVKDIDGCGLVLMDSGTEAVQDEIHRHQMKTRRFTMGEIITAEVDYEGDGYWVVDFAPVHADGSRDA